MNFYALPGQFDNELKHSYQELFGYGYGDLNVDALWKWSAVMQTIRQIGLLEAKRVKDVVEIGEVYSPLNHLLADNAHSVTVVRENLKDTWFPVSGKFYINAQYTPTNERNIQHVQQHFNAFASALEPESIDVFIDTSSLIHLNKQNKLGFHNDGCVIAGQHIYTALRSGGHFITACDIRHPDYFPFIENPGWLVASQIIDAYTASGLEFGKFDHSLGAFKDYTKAVQPVGSLPHKKLTPEMTGKTRDELLMHFDGETPLLLGVFDFIKP